MTEQLECITGYMDDHRTCTIRDHHDEYRHQYDDDPISQCTGCKPRPARYGFVCGPCYGRIEEAIIAAGPWFQLLRGIDKAITSEGSSGGRPSSTVNIAPVPLTFNEIQSFQTTFTGTAERWVADRAGAADAVRFARAVLAAVKKHPTSETAHNIKRTRCPECEQLTLVWNPPQYLGGQVQVGCRNPECEYEADHDKFDAIADIESPTGRTISKARIEHRERGDHCECGERLTGPLGWQRHILAVLEVAA